MADIKGFLANTLGKWFKSLGFAGALRWRILYWAYKLWPGLHIRHKEWDFVLDYLPKLAKEQNVLVLDVGCARTLFIYELARRGYRTFGIDKENYQENLPQEIWFKKMDVCNLANNIHFDFITCVSVLEHIPPDDQRLAFERMVQTLKTGGRLLLTIPTKEYAQGHPWKGFTFSEVMKMVAGRGIIIDYAERAGQICVAIERTI